MYKRQLDELDPHSYPIKTLAVNRYFNHVECFEIEIMGYQNANLYAKLLKPKEVKKKTPAVIFFHGYGDSSPEWTWLYQFAANGITVLALDIRGQGGRSRDSLNSFMNTFIGQIVRGIEEGPENLLLRQMYLDCVIATRTLFQFDWVDEEKIISYGASQGGGLAIATGALVPQISKIISIYPFLSDFKRVWEMGAANHAYLGISEYLRKYDPRHSNSETFFAKLNYVDVQHFAPMIKAETLMVIALRDEICPPSTQYAIYNKVKAQKQLWTYPDFGHEPIRNLNDEILKFLLINS